MDGVELLAQAHTAGLRVKVKGDVLSITGTPHAAALANQLLERKADIIPLLQADGTGSPPAAASTVLTQAMTWLSTMLASGPQLEADLMTKAQADGISKASLRRAKTALGIQSKRQGKHWVWVSPQGAQGAQGAHRQGAQGVQGTQGQDAQQGAQHPQDAQAQGAQGVPPIASKPFVGANGKLYTVIISQCQRCSGSNWGPKPDDADTWWCLDCARLLPETSLRADDRDEYACPSCHDLEGIVRDRQGTVCIQCRTRF